MGDLRLERLRKALSDRYDVECELKGGGQALVYRARDLKTPRTVAIKVIHLELADAAGVERFLREIRIAAGFTHPRIMTVYDSGEADGLPFYVMPLFEEGTLRDRLHRERQLPILDAVRIACEVAEALSYAHSRGVVHRDIKPENIMFSSGSAVVTDFGIARAVADSGLRVVTETGVTVGTPLYMSPEQIGAEATLDARSDIYSLATMTYEMLAGNPPFDADSAQKLMYKILTDPPPPITTVRPTVSVALERVVLRGLAKLPPDRFATAALFAEALRSGDRTEPDVPRESIAVLPFDSPPQDADVKYLAYGIQQEIIDALARVPGLTVAALTTTLSFRDRSADLPLEEIGAKLRVATVLEGSVDRAGARIRVRARLREVAGEKVVWAEKYDGDLSDVFAIQDEIAKGIAGRFQVHVDGPGATPPTKNRDAYHLYLKGRYHWQQRGPGLRVALKSFGEALALDPNYALAHAGLADACTVIAQYGMAPQTMMLPQARTAVARALQLAPELAEAHCAAGTLKLLFDWDWIGAEKDLRKSVELNPRYGAARIWLALYLALVQSRFEEAIQHASRAVELDPSALALAQLGMVFIAAGRHGDALGPIRKAAELNPTMLLPHLYLGVTYNYLGKTEEAIGALTEALQNSARHQLALAELAVCYHAIGKTNDVEAIHDEIMARGRREHMMSSMKALVTACVGRVDEAFTLIDRACDERDGILIYARRYPAFSLLQLDPRMQNVYRRMGFPP